MDGKTTLKLAAGGVILGGLVFAGFKVNKALKNRKAIRESKSYGKQTYKTDGSGGQTQTINLVETSDSIANGLGVNKSAWNPQSWTENDTDVYNAIKVVPKALINTLSDIYAKKYKRNLRSDLNEFLDSEYYTKIKSLLY